MIPMRRKSSVYELLRPKRGNTGSIYTCKYIFTRLSPGRGEAKPVQKSKRRGEMGFDQLNVRIASRVDL
jgi:hypothetical protein